MTDASTNREQPDHLEELIWALIDENLDDDGLRELEEHLLNDPQAREKYLDSCRLHVDLIDHFQPPVEPPPQSPVLGSLGEVFNDSSDRPPVV